MWGFHCNFSLLMRVECMASDLCKADNQKGYYKKRFKNSQANDLLYLWHKLKSKRQRAVVLWLFGYVTEPVTPI